MLLYFSLNNINEFYLDLPQEIENLIEKKDKNKYGKSEAMPVSKGSKKIRGWDE